MLIGWKPDPIYCPSCGRQMQEIIDYTPYTRCICPCGKQYNATFPIFSREVKLVEVKPDASTTDARV